MRQITEKLWLGNVAEFGDTRVLEAAGIELAVMCQGFQGFPHNSQIGALAVHIDQNGLTPDWVVRGLARLLVLAYNEKVLGVFDSAGGIQEGAFVVAAAFAEKQGQQWSSGRDWIAERVEEDVLVPNALSTQGQRLWPAA